MGTRAQEGRSEVGVSLKLSVISATQGFLKRNFMVGGVLVPYLVVFASSCVTQLPICVFQMDVFETDDSATKA